jgi:hypothetical protein
VVSDAQAWQVKIDVDGQLSDLLGPNYVGVGIGAKMAGTPPVPTGDLALVVLVEQKLPPGAVPWGQLIPASIQDVPTDVVEMEPLALQGVLQGGIRIEATHTGGGQEFQTDGTLGCLARTVDQPANQPPNVLLSNHHVLFNVHEETHQVNGAVGDEVRLPSCSGCCEPLIGKVLRGDQKLDAAIATLTPGQKLHARIHDIPVTGTLDITPGQWAQLPAATMQQLRRGELQVRKYGAKTGLTTGIVRCVGTTLGGTHLNSDIVIQPSPGKDVFSKKGDSGSVIIDRDGRVVSLLWGGPRTETAVTQRNRHSQKLTWSVPISYVETSLQITVARNPPVRVWHSPGTAPLLAVHRDLAGTATGRELLDGYGRHQAEVRALLAEDRRFVLAWHRGGGPQLVAALLGLAEGRIDAVPTELAGRPWVDVVHGLAGTLPELVSPPFAADIRAVAPLVAGLAGRGYPQVLELLGRRPVEASR